MILPLFLSNPRIADYKGLGRLNGLNLEVGV